MTRQEAIAALKARCSFCKYFPTCVHLKPECFKATEMAIRSLEALRKIEDEVYGCICQYEGLNAYRTNEFYNGRVEGMKMIQKIITKNLQEVENDELP